MVSTACGTTQSQTALTGYASLEGASSNTYASASQTATGNRPRPANAPQAVQKSRLLFGSHGTHTRQPLVAFVHIGAPSTGADTQRLQSSAQPGVCAGSAMSVASRQHLPAHVVLSYDVTPSPGNGSCGESVGTYGSRVSVAKFL